MVLVASVVAFFATCVVQRSWWSMIDLQVYRWGASVARSGGDIYGGAYENGLPFTYPPIAAIGMVPLTFVGLEISKIVLTCAGVFSIVVVVYAVFEALAVAHRLRWPVILCVTAMTLWLEPVQQTLKFGQLNLVLMAIVVTDLLLYADRRHAGFGVGLATAVKLTPGIFVLYLLVVGRIRAARNALAVMAGLSALGFVVAPQSSWQYWFEPVFIDADRVGSEEYVANQSLYGLLARLQGEAHASLVWLGAVLTILSIVVVAVRTLDASHQPLGIVAFAFAGLLISPISWSHHWVWFVPLIALSAAYAMTPQELQRLWWAVCGLALATLAWPNRGGPRDELLPQGIIWFSPYGGGREYQWSPRDVLVGNLYVALGMLIVLLVALMSFMTAATGSWRAHKRESTPRW